mmetsp:Transcript_24119/g.47922  ORF Transcript_24119/g.47922 Transcript_24119/m.47922 type:complete len:99 (-) Transcript_24119:33-329(-)
MIAAILDQTASNTKRSITDRFDTTSSQRAKPAFWEGVRKSSSQPSVKGWGPRPPEDGDGVVPRFIVACHRKGSPRSFAIAQEMELTLVRYTENNSFVD